MIEDLLLETEERMQAVIDVAKKELAAVRTGRANPALLNKIIVDYYGTPTPSISWPASPRLTHDCWWCSPGTRTPLKTWRKLSSSPSLV